MRLLLAGCGYVALELGRQVVAHGGEVWGLRRDVQGLPRSFRPIAADLTQPAQLEGLPEDLDYVLYSASAGEASDAAYQDVYVRGLSNLISALRDRPPKRFFFTSSTSVYGQSDGSWVDEASETIPAHFSGQRTLEAEALLERSGVPATILRCAGIYGPGRARLIEAVREGTAVGSERYVNRIHRDDLAGALLHLMRQGTTERRLLVSDDEPASQREVIRYLARALNVAEPPPGPEAAPARGGHKRCCNARLKATGYALRYPSYREGYGALIAGLAPRP